MVVDNSYNLYVADTNNQTIRKMNAAQMVATVGGRAGNSGTIDGTGTAALFLTPYGVAVDSQVNVYVARHREQPHQQSIPSGQRRPGPITLQPSPSNGGTVVEAV